MADWKLKVGTYRQERAGRTRLCGNLKVSEIQDDGSGVFGDVFVILFHGSKKNKVADDDAVVC